MNWVITRCELFHDSFSCKFYEGSQLRGRGPWPPAHHFAAPSPLGSVARLGRSRFDQLDVEGDRDFVADHHPAAVQFGVPLHAEILPVDFSRAGDPSALIAPGILDRSCRTLYFQDNLLADSTNRQIARHLQLAFANWLDFLRLERQCRVVGDVKKMLAAEVFVAVGNASIHRGGVNCDLHGGLCNVLVIELNRAGNFREVSPHVRNPQMPHREVSRRMGRVDLPRGTGGSCGECKQHRQDAYTADASDEPVMHEHSPFPYSLALWKLVGCARLLFRCAIWRVCSLCTGCSSEFRSSSPAGVMRVFTTRRSSLCRSRVTRPRFSMRSSRRVMSGSWEIMRSPISRHAQPSGSAPRRIRRTLYWAPVSPRARTTCSACWLSASAVRRTAIKTWSSRGREGRGLGTRCF